MNVLITGVSGFLGGETFKYLASSHNVYKLKSQNGGYSSLHLEHGKKIDAIIHFGWLGGSNSKDVNSIEQFDNIKTCIDLFRLTKESGIKKFIFITSTWENSLQFGLNNYGFCKAKAREILQEMASRSGVQLITACPWWVYGPNDRANRLIPSIISKCLNNETVELHPAQNLVDYIYVSDFSEGIKIILEKAFDDEPQNYYDICLGQGYKIKDVVDKIKSLSFSKSKILYTKEYPSNFNMIWIGNSNKLKKLGWEPKTNLSEGLIKTIGQIRESSSRHFVL